MIRMRDIHTIYSQLKQENLQLKTQLHDVTNELNQMQDQYQNRYQTLPIPCITVNCWGDILECNRIACVFFGRRSDRLCMDNLMKFLDADSKGRMNLFLQMMMEERLRSKIESSDLEIDFFVRGIRCATIVRYNLILKNQEPLLELSIWDTSEEKVPNQKVMHQSASDSLGFKETEEYLIEYDQNLDEFREYGDFFNASISKKEQVVKENFLQQVTECQKEWSPSYQLMKDIFLGKKVSGELNLSEIDYYNFYGWAYLEMIPREPLVGNDSRIGRMYDITEKKVRELRERENDCKDKITGFYHSEYGLNLLIKRLENGKLQNRSEHLILVSMSLTEEMLRQYGTPFLYGSLYLIGRCLKHLQEKEGGTIIRVGEKEFLILMDDRSKEEMIEIVDTLRRQLRESYSGHELYGVIEYKVVLQPMIHWSNYPDWRLVVQELYEQAKKSKEEVVTVDSKIANEFCREEPVVVEHYAGTTKIIHKEKQSFLAYAYELLEHSLQIECAILLLLNMIGILKQLQFIYIYDWDIKQNSQNLLYQWEREVKETRMEYDIYQLWDTTNSSYIANDYIVSEKENVYWKFNSLQNHIKKVIIYGFSKEDRMEVEEKQVYEELSNLLFLAMQYSGYQVATKELARDLQVLKQAMESSKENLSNQIIKKMEETIRGFGE